MKKLSLLFLLFIMYFTGYAQTPWVSTPAITPQTRTNGLFKELRFIQSPSFIFSLQDSLNSRLVTASNGLTKTGNNIQLGGSIQSGNVWLRGLSGGDANEIKISFDNYYVDWISDYLELGGNNQKLRFSNNGYATYTTSNPSAGGFQADGTYESGYNDNSYTSKRYVDAKVAGAGYAYLAGSNVFNGDQTINGITTFNGKTIHNFGTNDFFGNVNIYNGNSGFGLNFYPSNTASPASAGYEIRNAGTGLEFWHGNHNTNTGGVKIIDSNIYDSSGRRFLKITDTLSNPLKNTSGRFSLLAVDSLGKYTQLQINNSAAFRQKIKNGTSVFIAFYGTSITYGQQFTGGVNTQINGATQTRTRYPYPESVDTLLTIAGIAHTFANRGYPGDKASTGLTRWNGASTADAVLVEYATNEAANAGGLGFENLSLFKSNLTLTVERYLNQGSYVIGLLPGPIAVTNSTYVNSELIKPFRDAAKEVYKTFGIETVDIEQAVHGLYQPYDIGSGGGKGFHFTDAGYSEIAGSVAAVLLKNGFSAQTVGPGDRFHDADNILSGPNVAVVVNTKTTTGFSIRPATATSTVMPVYVRERTSMFSKQISTASTQTVTWRYSNGIPKADIVASTAISAASTKFNLFTLEPGWRTIVVTAGVSTPSIDEIGFDPSDGGFSRDGKFPNRISTPLNTDSLTINSSLVTVPSLNGNSLLLTDANGVVKNNSATNSVSTVFSNIFRSTSATITFNAGGTNVATISNLGVLTLPGYTVAGVLTNTVAGVVTSVVPTGTGTPVYSNSPIITGNANFTNINSAKIGNAVTFNSATATVTPTLDSLSFVDGQKHVSKLPIAGNGISITQSPNTITIAATGGRSAVNVTANQTMVLNTDYQNISTTQYILTLPPSTSFATQGSLLITVLATGTGGAKISVPTGYALQTPAGATLTDGTGYVTIAQYQKIQLIPSTTTANTYYCQPLNGTITVH